MTKSAFKRLESSILKEFNDIDPVGIAHVEDPSEYLEEVHWLLKALPGISDEGNLGLLLAERLKGQFGVDLNPKRIEDASSRLWRTWSSMNRPLD